MIDQSWYISGSQQTRNLNWFCHFFHLSDGSSGIRRRKVLLINYPGNVSLQQTNPKSEVHYAFCEKLCKTRAQTYNPLLACSRLMVLLGRKMESWCLCSRSSSGFYLSSIGGTLLKATGTEYQWDNIQLETSKHCVSFSISLYSDFHRVNISLGDFLPAFDGKEVIIFLFQP